MRQYTIIMEPGQTLFDISELLADLEDLQKFLDAQ